MNDPIISTQPLGFPWPTLDPFLFCAHHDDDYPAGDERLAPRASLAGRNIGQDFVIKDGWRMYHGSTVPGFPQHPHRGFETVTLARKGYIDHSDSLGATARFGKGDVQWMTAGKGVVHSEMFPLVNQDARNPTELFQVWLNLPAKDKMVDPHFTMLWADTIPRLTAPGLEVVMVTGAPAGMKAPSPPPASWASRAEAAVAIWTIRLGPGVRWTLPAAPEGVQRTLYFFRGSALDIQGRAATPSSAIQVRGEALELSAGPDEVELLLLQGRPIGEPVAHYGPFVMNTRAELEQAFSDYQRTRFGGWPWKKNDPAHPRDQGRFAIHADGRREEPKV
jgi:quercetin 2,3-dioxygenase